MPLLLLLPLAFSTDLFFVKVDEDEESMVSLLKMHSCSQTDISRITGVDCFQARAQIELAKDFEVPSNPFQ